MGPRPSSGRVPIRYNVAAAFEVSFSRPAFSTPRPILYNNLRTGFSEPRNGFFRQCLDVKSWGSSQIIYRLHGHNVRDKSPRRPILAFDAGTALATSLLVRMGVTIRAEYLPSALNQYACRLSRRRSGFNYHPHVEGGPEKRFRVGASAYDYQRPRTKELWIRPLLDNVRLAMRKALQEKLRGTIFIP